MPLRRFLRIALSTLLAISAPALLAPGADATVIIDLELEEMVDQADAVVHARVLSSGSRLELRQGRLVPVTIVEIEVSEWWVGEGEARVRLREPGGAHPGGRTEVLGAPRYTPGEEVVLFLRSEPPYYRTLSLSHGKLVVRRPRGPAAATVAREHHPGLLRVREDGKHDVDAALSLEELRERVQRRRREAAESSR